MPLRSPRSERTYHRARMNLQDLRYLVAIAEHRHFGRAAEACFVSQPTLSTQLRKLEKELGGGLRQDAILVADSEGRATASEAAHAAWVATRKTSLATASTVSISRKRFMSPPAWKDAPVPVMTAARTWRPRACREPSRSRGAGRR